MIQKTCRVTLADIQQAKTIISPIIRRTPLLSSQECTDLTGVPVFLKLENLQKTGSFKIRGAYYKLSKLAHEHVSEVAAISAGNHAQGVAFAGKLTGIASTIFMPEDASLFKIQSTQKHGAKVICQGKNFEEAKEYALIWLQDRPMPFISPFDDDDIITGQGSIGLEIVEQLPEVKTVVVPVGGGGLISGIALALKALKPDVDIIGVQTEAAHSLCTSFQEKKLVHVPSSHTIADGIAIKQPAQRTFEIIMEYVDEMVTVSESDLIQALFFCISQRHFIAEGAGVAGLAAVLSRKAAVMGSTVILISGGNIDITLIDAIIRKGMVQIGRYLTFRTLILDYPGSLKKVLDLVAKYKGNILSIQHARWHSNIPLGHTEVEIYLETRDHEHGDTIVTALEEKGYTILRF